MSKKFFVLFVAIGVILSGIPLTGAEFFNYLSTGDTLRAYASQDADGSNGDTGSTDLNLAPDCSGAYPNIGDLWPPNHSMTSIEVLGVTDPDGDSVEITIQCILQDEPLNDTGDGNTEYDGDGINTSTALIRQERSGNGDGRTYHIDFIATDSRGAQCGGEVLVSVGHDKKSKAIDGGRLYQSIPSDNECGRHDINNPPVIITEAITSGVTWEPYHYDVNAHDPDMDPLTYAIVQAPDGLNIDPASGIIGWSEPVAGEYPVLVQVDDGRGGTAQQSFTLFINGPPTITSTPPTEVLATFTYQYSAAATDPNNDTLAWQLTQAPAGMIIDSATGAITWTPTLDQIGAHQVAIEVHDGRGGSDSQSWTLTAISPNEPPEITNNWPPIATSGVPYSHTVTATDPDGDILTYTLSAAPNGMVIDAGTGAVTWTPAADQIGTHPVTVIVADGKGGSTEQSASLSVLANEPPEIVSQPSDSVLEGDLYQYDVEATDPNGDILTYASAGYSSQVEMDASSGLLTWQPFEPFTPFNEVDNPYCEAPLQTDSSYWQVGGWQVFHDEGGHDGIQTWRVTADGTTAIADGNGDPSVYLSDIELSDAVVEISIRVNDRDNDHVGFVWGFQGMQHYYRLRWDQGNGTGLLVTKIDTPEPRYGWGHETDVHLFQNTELSWKRWTNYRFLLDVKPGHASIFLFEGDKILESIQIKDDRYLTGKFGFYVASQSGVYYKARYIDRQPAPDIVVESVNLQPLNELEDRIEIRVRNRGAVATDIVTPVRIQEGTVGTEGWFVANQLLAVTEVPPLTAGETVTLQVDTISLNGLDALLGVKLDDANQISECNEGNNDYLAPIIDVRVNDPEGTGDRQHFVVNLDDVNEPPHIEPVASHFAVLGETFETDILATDPDYGDHIRFELVAGPEAMGFYPGTSRLVWTPSNEPVNQDYEVTIRAFDLQGASDESTFQVTLHRKPEITSTPIYVARRSESYAYDVEAIDPDGDPLTYELSEAPAQMQIDDQTGVISWVAPESGGYHPVTIRVSDGRNGIAEQRFDLGVLEPGEVNITPSLAHNTPPAQTSMLADYEYQFTTIDADGLEPAYTLLEGPIAMSLDAADGLLTWPVPITEQCTHAVRIQVYDRRGGFDEFAYSIRIIGDKRNPPVINSSPVYDATESYLYAYHVEATDWDGDPLSYLLNRAPEGMTIDQATGQISWIPTVSQIGVHPVEVGVENNLCGYTSQS